MRVEISVDTVRGPFVREIEDISGQDLLACNQCGKCSAGCPVVSVMDMLPSQVIRLAQLGLENVLLSPEGGETTIWLCASCLTCATRCPKGVDVPRLMEAIRQIALRRGAVRMDLGALPADLVGALPQVAIVGAYRKYVK
jgi:heterodisulfide reductase subunit C